MAKSPPTENEHLLTLTHLKSTTDGADGHNGLQATGTRASSRGRL